MRFGSELCILEVFQRIERLITVAVREEPVRLNQAFHLGFYYAVDTKLLVFDLPLYFLDHWVKFSILIRQAFLKFNL